MKCIWQVDWAHFLIWRDGLVGLHASPRSMNIVQANAEIRIGARIGGREGASTGILGAATLGLAVAVEEAAAVGRTRDSASVEADQYAGSSPADNALERAPAPSP